MEKILALVLFLFSVSPAFSQFTKTEDLRVKPPEAWQPHDIYGLDLSLGGGWLNGNVKNASFNGGLAFDWKAGQKSAFFLEASDNYVEYNDAVVTDKFKGSVLYAYAVKPRLNVFFQTTHSHNKFLDIKYRTTNTLGLCYHNFLSGFFKPVMLSAGLTPEYDRRMNDQIERDFRATARLNFALALTDTVNFKGDLIYTPRIADFSDYRLYSEAFLEFKVWKERVAFRVTATNEYDSDPYPGVKKNDFGIFHSLVVKFSK